jgi:hypothetical protein
MKCLTGWFAFGYAFKNDLQHWQHLHHWQHCFFYLLAGLFVGAMFEAVRKRWL